MRRNEATVFFAIVAGVFFLVSILLPVFLYAFGATRHDREFALIGFLLLGIGNGAGLYGISVILREMGHAPAPPPAVEPERAEILQDAKAPAEKPYPSAKEMMSSVKTLIELENWKLAHQRAFELIEVFPQSEEAAKLKKNLDYLQKKSVG